MAMIKKGGAHGLWKVLVQLTGSDGISYGIAGSGIADGVTTLPLVLDYPKQSNIPLPDRTTIDFTGGDTWITSFQYGMTSLGSFEFTMQDLDADLIALVTGTNVNQVTNDEWTELTEDPMAEDRPQVSLMFIYRMQSFEVATFGQTYYIQTVVPRCWCAPKGLQNAPAFQSAGDYAFQVTPSSAGRRLNGEPFSTNLGATNNTLSHYHLISANPLYMATHRVTGTDASIIGAYEPISSVVGSAGSTKCHLVKYVVATDTATQGVADTITTATATIAVGTALTVAATNVLTALYETAYVAV